MIRLRWRHDLTRIGRTSSENLGDCRGLGGPNDGMVGATSVLGATHLLHAQQGQAHGRRSSSTFLRWWITRTSPTSVGFDMVGAKGLAGRIKMTAATPIAQRGQFGLRPQTDVWWTGGTAFRRHAGRAYGGDALDVSSGPVRTRPVPDVADMATLMEQPAETSSRPHPSPSSIQNNEKNQEGGRLETLVTQRHCSGVGRPNPPHGGRLDFVSMVRRMAHALHDLHVFGHDLLDARGRYATLPTTPRSSTQSTA